jgi:hypothetical protein
MMTKVRMAIFLIAGFLAMGFFFSYLDQFDRWLGCNLEYADTCIAKGLAKLIP